MKIKENLKEEYLQLFENIEKFGAKEAAERSGQSMDNVYKFIKKMKEEGLEINPFRQKNGRKKINYFK